MMKTFLASVVSTLLLAYSAILGWRVTDSGQPDMDYRLLHARDEDTGEWRAVGGLMALIISSSPRG